LNGAAGAESPVSPANYSNGGILTKALSTTTEYGLKPDTAGKVRDVFDLGDELIIVATDRISAYDSILPQPIPGKGIILTQMTIGWYEFFESSLKTHFVTADVAEFPEPFKNREELAGRSMRVRKADRFDIECVVRGYITGSGWREYQESGSVCGIRLPDGLKESQQLAEPIFTPATKADTGHDENISFERMCEIVPRETSETLRDLSIDIYLRALEYARERGIILADTKFEFGVIDGEITNIDEMLSPDSSRFWAVGDFEPGRSQESFDKQFIRNYLDEIGWDHNPPPPDLSQEVVRNSFERYKEAFDRLFPNRDLEKYL
jgi:phosphoribosylaminoimidazole-succinocarboxamide synthase